MRLNKLPADAFDTPMQRARVRMITGDITIFRDGDDFTVVRFNKQGEQKVKMVSGLDKLIQHITNLVQEN